MALPTLANLKKNYQSNAVALHCINTLFTTHKSVFLTGKAGSGKSTLLKKITETINKEYVLLAPTGIAAINIGGQTIHSFLGLGVNLYHPDDYSIKANYNKRDILKSVELIVIDEISMVRADLLHALDVCLRNATGKPIPFGGKQLLLVGDLFQLPPVVNIRETPTGFFTELYGSEYFFSAPGFGALDIEVLELTHIYRQSEESFINALNECRYGTLSDYSLQVLNSRVLGHQRPTTTEIVLTATNAVAATTNTRQLQLLKTTSKIYSAEINGKFTSDSNQLPADVNLELKEGARVMFTKNDNKSRWVNGTSGHITQLGEKTVTVELDSGRVVEVEPQAWEKYEFKINPDTNAVEKEEVGIFKQLPLRIAWAVTIHKSQGLTFESLVLNLEARPFATGQTYVALSRCTTLGGLYLTRPLTKRDLQADPRLTLVTEHWGL